MLSLFSATSSYNVAGARPAVQARAATQMANIDAFDDIWGLAAQTSVFNAWDPEKPRDYENFNPFERNLDGAKCDMNGCFPGESRGYSVPNRPDVNWQIMQEEKVKLEELAKDPKWGLKGKPGCYSLKWQAKLGAPPYACARRRFRLRVWEP